MPLRHTVVSSSLHPSGGPDNIMPDTVQTVRSVLLVFGGAHVNCCDAGWLIKVCQENDRRYGEPEPVIDKPGA